MELCSKVSGCGSKCLGKVPRRLDIPALESLRRWLLLYGCHLAAIFADRNIESLYPVFLRLLPGKMLRTFFALLEISSTLMWISVVAES
jgi:hypothetical protein